MRIWSGEGREGSEGECAVIPSIGLHERDRNSMIYYRKTSCS